MRLCEIFITMIWLALSMIGTLMFTDKIPNINKLNNSYSIVFIFIGGILLFLLMIIDKMVLL